MNRDHLMRQFGIALSMLTIAVSTASAADSISNSLTGFTGNSTQAATQTALMNAGFNLSDTDASNRVDFSATGAAFGTGLDNNDGRNYVRTIDDDYANHSFVAEITVSTPSSDLQDVYFGFGAGTANPDFFRIADFASDRASVMYFGENEPDFPTIEVLRTNNASSRSVFLDPATGLGDGTYRVRLDYNWFQKSAVYSFDLNYAGGPFVADLTVPALSTLDNYSSTGWPSEDSRIYFGGDEGASFKDLQVTVTSDAFLMGDFTNDGNVTTADWMVLRANQHTNLSSKSASEAYLLGDMNGDKASNFEDFRLFKQFFEDTNGAGSFAVMVAGIPEPSTLLLAVAAALFAMPQRRRSVAV
jgi:hypothetical protein